MYDLAPAPVASSQPLEVEPHADCKVLQVDPAIASIQLSTTKLFAVFSDGHSAPQNPDLLCPPLRGERGQEYNQDQNIIKPVQKHV